MPACQEQFNLTKSETGESEIIAFESEETVVEKITVESKRYSDASLSRTVEFNKI